MLGLSAYQRPPMARPCHHPTFRAATRANPTGAPLSPLGARRAERVFARTICRAHARTREPRPRKVHERTAPRHARTRAAPPRLVADRARAAAPAKRHERTQPPRAAPPARRTRGMVRHKSHERIPPVRNEPAHSHARTRAAPHRWQIEPERPPVQRHERTRRPCSLSHARRTRAMVSPASALPQSGCRPRAGTHRRHQLGS